MAQLELETLEPGLVSQLKADINESLVNLPSSVSSVISSALGLQAGASPRQGYGGGLQAGASPRQGYGGGCNDAYSAFAFLSFLFALLTFIQNNGGGRRRRAAPGQCYSGHVSLESREETSLLASAVMFRAFVNALDNGEDLDCSQYSLCEGRKQVNSLNTIGATIGLLAENKANQLLGIVGRDYDIDHEECLNIFPCENLPPHYRYPAIKR